MANSKLEKAIIKAKGKKPKKKNINPDVIMLYVKPLNMFNNIWPESIFAPSLKPKDTLRAKYEINSIITNRGSRFNGHPLGTNKEKNSNPCLFKPNNVAPNTTVKLNENVSAK